MKVLKSFISKHVTIILVLVILVSVGLLAIFASPNEDGTRTFDGNNPVYTDAQKQALCETKSALNSEIKALSGINAPQDSTSGCEPTDLPQMGSLVYYEVSMGTAQDFYDSVNGKGFNEGYGYQCVAGFKEFMYSLSGKYVAASGGGAKGYATQQSQIEPLGFTWHAGTEGLQNGDWAIWTTGTYGHVSMYFNGQWFGQNQYAADPNVGNAFNIASISKSGIAGYYRPNIYNVVAPVEPETPVTPETPTTSNTYTVKSGDTLGEISLEQGWYSKIEGLYGDSGYAQKLADYNNIVNRGLIYPNTIIKRF
jgi:LysM repeat protein